MSTFTGEDFAKVKDEMIALQREMREEEDMLGKALGTSTSERIRGMFKTRLPEPEDREAYRGWERERMMQKSIPKPAKLVTDYIDTIERTNYVDDQSLQLLVWLLNAQSHPFIDIDTYKGNKYRLAPSAMEMCANEAHNDWDFELPLALECVLGVDIIDGVIQGSTRAGPQELDGEEVISDTTNTSSATSAVKNGHTGFAFMQLGKVHNISATDWTEASSQDEEAYEMHWEETGYGLAVVINDDGSADEVWLLFDFEPLDDFTQEVSSIAEDDSDWGYLKGDDVRRAGVKIADNIL